MYTNGYAIDEYDNNLYILFKKDFKERNLIGSILLDCYITSPTNVMIRAELFKKIGLFKVNNQSMDHDMFIRLSEVTNFFYLPECLIGYRRHPNQQSLNRRQWEDGFTILNDACKRYPYPSKIRRKRLSVLHYRLGEYDLLHGQYVKSFFNFFLSGILDPLRATCYVGNNLINKLNFFKN